MEACRLADGRVLLYCQSCSRNFPRPAFFAMRLLPLLIAAAALLTACSDTAPPSSDPPEGWVAESPTRWYTPGADTSAAFRDLSTVEAMGVARDDSEFVRWAQETMTDFYRTNPEVVDSIFAADYLAEVRAAEASEGDAANALVDRIKTEYYQRYNPAQYRPETPFALPPDLAEVDGIITTQVYVGADNQAVAVMLLEGTGTRLDQMMMRRALDGPFTDAWVRETAGQSEGVKIPSWVRISSNYARQ